MQLAGWIDGKIKIKANFASVAVEVENELGKR